MNKTTLALLLGVFVSTSYSASLKTLIDDEASKSLI
jgi:hypothetical protein